MPLRLNQPSRRREPLRWRCRALRVPKSRTIARARCADRSRYPAILGVGAGAWRFRGPSTSYVDSGPTDSAAG